MAHNQYTSVQKRVPWNREYNKDKALKYFVKRTPDGKVHAIISDDQMVKPIRVVVEPPKNPKDWKQKISEAFHKAEKILEEMSTGKGWVDYRTEEVLKKRPFWNLFTQPFDKFWKLVRKIK
jgi:hypothetical protein